HKWLCEACRGWRTRYHHAERACPGCGRRVVVNHRGYCRLCCRDATVRHRLEPAHRVLDVAALTRHGHQLFIADLILKKRNKPRAASPTTPRRGAGWPAGVPVTHQQLVLFTWPRTLNADHLRQLDVPIPALAAA